MDRRSRPEVVVLRDELPCFVAIYALLRGPVPPPVPHLLRPGKGRQLSQEAPILSVVWLIYPIVFIIGQEGLRLWIAVIDGALFTTLDIIAKVAYGLYDVSMAKSVTPKDKDLLEGSGAKLAQGR